MNKPFLTVFTPTFNRVHTLRRLYDSLLAQTDSDFEWLIVDDGSEDDTGAIVSGWAKDAPFSIRYLWQENSGKHVAHNLGANEAQGRYFICVDSDDWLESNAITTIRTHSRSLGSDVGLIYPKLFNTQAQLLSTEWVPQGTREIQLSDLRMRYGFVIETAIVFNTSVLRRHPFPVIETEHYIPEEASYHDYRYPETFWAHSDCFYRCEYLKEGLTRNIWSNWLRNPVGTKLALRKRYEVANRYRTLCGVKNRISAIVGIESLNVALGLPVMDGVPCHAAALCLRPVSYAYARKRFGEVAQ